MNHLIIGSILCTILLSGCTFLDETPVNSCTAIECTPGLMCNPNNGLCEPPTGTANTAPIQIMQKGAAIL